ncbi:MAG: hypothetical protein C0505_03945 [Leptothrix sp. (in: Bacteria)]|nr:hypothetical protein [Leptothrix sp. (in: b-proteobacteria)]
MLGGANGVTIPRSTRPAARRGLGAECITVPPRCTTMPTDLKTASEPATTLRHNLGRLVVKGGVALGLLAPDEQALALAFVWAGLPEGVVMNEREVNAVLREQLAGPVQCLATDHVELRRWLVDAGWLQRDGYGREYRRVAAGPALRRALAQALTEALAGQASTAWAAARRAAHEAEREARRQRWQAQAQALPGQAA